MTVRTHAHLRPTGRLAALTATLVAATLSVSGCSVLGGNDGDAPQENVVSLLTHESFELPDDVIAEFESTTGLELRVIAAGDAGSIATELALNPDNPRGDVVFGIDTTFASRVLDAGAFAAHGVTLPAGAEKYALAEGADRLVPVDEANVCVNVDTDWFTKQKIEPPKTLDDLLDPTYRDLLVVPGASTSSPGLSFLLATIAAQGDDWQEYWAGLLGNGAKVVDGWTEAYYTDFTAASEKGNRPIVVSYDSSPAFTLDGDRSTTAALLDTCFAQVEYAGVLRGAEHPENAKKLLDFLLSKDVQDVLPDSMYVFPVSDDATLPADWAKHAVQPDPEKVLAVSPAEIAENRETWLRAWNDVVTR
ncbi:thiamine ABC transporter substrate-binding protein [Nocardioides yefusunii]|uniref:Thiamine ABC transporter substrate binding subunit n=1 Tax=Nocardioides yefusunii TaxID=2500546 RepID=A0ABW1QXG3_9ACTN|nr:thiamine ABC transporter substrate-binding protein [Nocardioides yefusunii]